MTSKEISGVSIARNGSFIAINGLIMERIDFLFYRGEGFIGAITRWQTRGPYGHVAVKIRNTIYEAQFGKGVIKREATEKDHVDTHSLFVNEGQLADGLKFLNAQLGKPYDTLMVLRFISRRKESYSTVEKWFCSELLFTFCVVMGIYLLARTLAWEVHPNLFSRSPLLSPSSSFHESSPAWPI